jgi:hypothetical protein
MLNFYFHESFSLKELRHIYLVLSDCGLKYSKVPRHDYGYFNFSFDDNYTSWLELGKLEFGVTMYLNTIPFEDEAKTEFYLKRINKPSTTRIMSDKEGIQYLIDSGHLFGFHTHGHINISQTEKFQISKEISLNRLYFDRIGITEPLNQLAIPYGMLKYVREDQITDLLKEFDAIVFANPGLLGKSSNQIIHRIEYINELSLNKNIYRARKILPQIFMNRMLNFDIL